MGRNIKVGDIYLYTKDSKSLYKCYFTIGKMYIIIEIKNHSNHCVILDDYGKRISFHPRSDFGRSLVLLYDDCENQNYEEWIEE